MPPLTNKKFITELGRMSNSVTYTGAISITFKRCIYNFLVSFTDNADVNCFPSKKKAEPDAKKNRCLVRAVSPRKKISTIVSYYRLVLKYRLLLGMFLRLVEPLMVYCEYFMFLMDNYRDRLRI